MDSTYLGYPWKVLLGKRLNKGIEHTEDTLRYVKQDCYIYDYPSKRANASKVKQGAILCSCGERKGWSMLIDSNEVFYGYIPTAYLEGVSGGDGSHYALN